tara:strand:+ start:24 stop:263 length:240 start_codon:yes stop_codon:yes gene_type:complete
MRIIIELMYIELKHSHKRKTMSEIEEKPYPSWVWDDTLNTWLAPVSLPDDIWIYLWDENSISWVGGGCKINHPTEQVFS